MTDTDAAAIGLARLAGMVRAEATNGLYWGAPEPELERLRRMRRAAAELTGLVDHRSVAEIQAIFDQDEFLRTPIPATEFRIACSDGVQVIRRRRLSRSGRSLGQRLEDLAQVLRTEVSSEVVGIADTDISRLPCPHTFLLAYEAATPLASSEVEAVLEPGDPDLDGPLEFLPPGQSAVEREAERLPVSPAVKLILDELAVLCKEGFESTSNFYERERYERVEALCENAIETDLEYPRIDCGDLAAEGLSTGADGAVFDEQGRLLLLRRTDTGQWAMPGGAAEVGETVGLAAVREVAEESGLDVIVTDLNWAFDKRDANFGDTRMPMIMSFQARVNDPDQPIRLQELEASDFRWVTEEEIESIDFFKGHNVRVPRAFATRRR